jgi:hypothetical protein
MHLLEASTRIREVKQNEGHDRSVKHPIRKRQPLGIHNLKRSGVPSPRYAKHSLRAINADDFGFGGGPPNGRQKCASASAHIKDTLRI